MNLTGSMKSPLGVIKEGANVDLTERESFATQDNIMTESVLSGPNSYTDGVRDARKLQQKLNAMKISD